MAPWPRRGEGRPLTLPRRRRLVRLPDTPPDTVPEGTAELAAVRELARGVLSARDPAELFQAALDRVGPLVGASMGTVYLVDGASELMRLAAAHRWPESHRRWLGEARVRVGFGASGEAVAERRVIEVADLFAADGVEDWQEVAAELGFRALLAVPLSVERDVLGVVTWYFADATRVAPLGRLLARAAAELMALGADRVRQREVLRRAEAQRAEQQLELDRAESAVVEAERELVVVSDALAEVRRDPARLDGVLDLVDAARGALSPDAEECDPRAPLREALHRAALAGVRLEAPVLALEPLTGDRRRITRLLVSLLTGVHRRAGGAEVVASVVADDQRVVYRVAVRSAAAPEEPLPVGPLARAVARALGGVLTADDDGGSVVLDLPLRPNSGAPPAGRPLAT